MMGYLGISWAVFVGYRASQRVSFPGQKSEKRRLAKRVNLMRKEVVNKGVRGRVKIPRSINDKLKRGRKGYVIRRSVPDYNLLQ